MNVKGCTFIGFFILFLSVIALLASLIYITLIKSPLDISSLQNSKTAFRNKQELVEKIDKLIQGGREHLQIVTDFDQTLTADPGELGKTVLNSYEMLRRCPSIPESYKDEDTKLYLKYKPFEQDPNLSIEEKSKYLINWYKESQNLLRGFKFPREELDDIARNVSNSFRERVHILMEWSEKNQIPVLVLSSGLGDAVVASLKAANLLQSNVKVVANFLELDENDIIIGSKGDPIHSYNKNEASLRNTDYYQKIKERNNVVLLGDSIGDANMTDGMENCETVIKIGFLSRKKKDQLETYLNHFDIVIKDDQTMDIVNNLLNLL